MFKNYPTILESQDLGTGEDLNVIWTLSPEEAD